MTKKKTTALTEEQKNKIAEKTKDPESIRKSIQNIVKDYIWVGATYKKGEKFLKKFLEWGELTPEDNTNLTNIMNGINPFLTHRFMVGLIKDEGERTGMMEFAEDIAKEYDCKTTMELSLCDLIASSYYWMMKGSQQMQCMYSIEYLSNEKNGYYSMISKEVEKQSRLYMNAMMTLRALKSPFGNVSIRAKNAFIWENQQFNNNPLPETWANL